MTPDDFRRIALGMKDAVEAAHMGHPDFRVNGRIFATLASGDERGMVKLTPAQQLRFLADAPETFAPAAGAWGLQGATMVRLATADEEMVGEAMTLAWRNIAAGRPTKTAAVARTPRVATAVRGRTSRAARHR